MKRNSPITHNGAPCQTCTDGESVHANNVHFVTRKGFRVYFPCKSDCNHPVSEQKKGQ